MYADVILPLAISSRLSYRVPTHLEHSIDVGSLVRVPLGRSNIYRGVVVEVGYRDSDTESVYKDIISVDRREVATTKQLKLWNWITSYYCCGEGHTMRVFMPSPLRAKITDSSLREREPSIEVVLFVTHSDEETHDILNGLKRSKSQLKCLSIIIEKGQNSGGEIFVSLPQLIEEGTSRQAVKDLQKRGIVEIINHNNPALYHSVLEPLVVCDKIKENTMTAIELSSSHKPLLIEGCAPHREQQLLDLVERLSSQEEDATILLLTPDNRSSLELVDFFRRHSTLYVIPYYGAMSTAARAESYVDTLSKEGRRIVIGSRAAIGLPFTSLLAIIVDQEHDTLYKQGELQPCFNARDCAAVASRIYSTRLLLLSETPSMESMYNVSEGKYQHLFVGERPSPKVTIIDRRGIAKDQKRKEGEDSNTRYISHYLHDRIADTLGAGGRVLIYHSRRGFSQYLICKECGDVPRCPSCNVSLTYHKAKGSLECHYCGYRRAISMSCSLCGKDMILKGIGTENIEERICEEFPGYSVCRIDQDSVGGNKKGCYHADITVGTQMIKRAVGMGEFALSVVINSDTLLSLPDFRATEYAMQVISQLKMMTSVNGELIVQGTLDSTAYPAMMRSSYRDIYPSQITERRLFAYPPITKMIALHIAHRSKEPLDSASALIYGGLKDILASRVSPPEAPFVEYLGGEYRRHIFIKVERELSLVLVKEKILQILANVLAHPSARGTTIKIDVDPRF